MQISDGVKTGMLEALEKSMSVVRQYQQMGVCGDVETKSDATILTPADKASDVAGKEILRTIPGITIHGEESEVEGSGDIIVYLDGLDGSIPYATGAGTSTVIVAAVEKTESKVVYCLVGEPQSGRIWRAESGGCCELSSGRCRDWRVVRTYAGSIDSKSRVFIDSYPGFRKNSRVILTTVESDRLHSLIQKCSGLLMLGSNGMHHALVANGGKGAVGAITTAIGGPWDVCPVLLVQAAGGTVRAFAVDDNGYLDERDYLKVTSYDIVISGNSMETVDVLFDLLQLSLTHER